MKPVHFQRVMNFIGQRQQEPVPGWLSHILYCYKKDWASLSSSSGRPLGRKASLLFTYVLEYDITNLLSDSDSIAYFWSCWECAKFCIVTRLRTPFGGPVQTFESIERLVASAAAVNDLQAIGTRPNHWRPLPTKLLLQFVDLLEKQIFLSHDGNLPQIPQQAQKNSTVFFRANRKVCDDWFSRMRQLLVVASVVNESSPDIIRHATQVSTFYCVIRLQRLHDLFKIAQFPQNIKDPKRLIADFEFCLIHLGMCYCLHLIITQPPPCVI